ncbi:hypothetical protein [Roseibium album]|uniref:hypothetical protein n=1 Tax=Roseibium album TaxID=311410 RepID=UPI002492ECCA|nr:hypothetical protein [Roseibium album]
MDWWKYNYLPLFNTGEGSGAGGGGGEGEGDQGGEGGQGSGEGDGEGGRGGGEGGQGSGEGEGGSSAIYKPQGLADHLMGESNEGTIDNLKKALDGYRERDGEIPEESSAYAEFQEDAIPETLRPHIKELSSDPLFAKVTEKAKELRVPRGAFQSLTTELYTAAADAGLLEAPIDVEAERQALTPEHAQGLPEAEQKIARDKRMNANFGWLDLLAGDEKSSVSKEIAEHVKTELGDSAFGHQFIEAMRSKIGGTGGPGGNGNGADNDTAGELTRRAGLPENTPGNSKFSQESYDKMIEDYKKHYGE